MSMKKFVDDEVLTAAELNSSFGKSLRQTGQVEIAQLQDRAVTSSADGGQFAEAYIDADGRNNSVVAADTTAEFDTDKYEVGTLDSVYVIISATSLTVGDFSINNCTITPYATGKWVLQCSTGTDEVKRAQLYKTLYWGTTGDDPRANPDESYIVGLTAIETSVSRDIGKKGTYATCKGVTANTSGNNDTINYDGTFTNPGDDVSVWGRLFSNDAGSQGRIEFPTSTTILSQVGTGTADETGTDKTADEDDAPASTKLYILSGGNDVAEEVDTRAFFLHEGTVSWVATEVQVSSTLTYSNIDFGVYMTAVTSSAEYNITHTIPTGTFGSTLSSAFATFKAEDWESGADVQYKLTNATEDTGWLSTNEVVSFTALTAEPDDLIVKLIPKTTTPTAKFPSINGVALYGDKV